MAELHSRRPAGASPGPMEVAAGSAYRSPLGAMRRELGMVAALLALAGVAWCSTAERMAGMQAGPGSALGSVGWFTGVWATMMAAMMLPSLAPAAASYAAAVRRKLSRVLLFAFSYLALWSAAGIGAYGLFGLGRTLWAGSLAWHSGGRPLAAGVLALAALYQLTPLKREFLSRCRSSPRSPAGAPPGTRREALVAGLRAGGWCLGSSWALMAALFALGVMSLLWMALVAVLVAFEKLGPAGRRARLTSAVVMLVLAIAVFALPNELPGFVVPGSPAQPQTMKAMG